MKVYCVFSTDLISVCEKIETLQKIFSTKENADNYLHDILKTEKKRRFDSVQDMKSRLEECKYYQQREAIQQTIENMKKKARRLKIKDLDYVIKEYDVD